LAISGVSWRLCASKIGRWPLSEERAGRNGDSGKTAEAEPSRRPWCDVRHHPGRAPQGKTMGAPVAHPLDDGIGDTTPLTVYCVAPPGAGRRQVGSKA